jgi:hypothetical protein
MENFWQAWHVLSNLQISCRKNVKPGKTVLVKNLSSNVSHDVGRRTTLQGSFDIDKSSECIQTHKTCSETNGKISQPGRCVGNHFASTGVRDVEAEKSLTGQSQIRTSIVNNSQIFDRSFSRHAVHIDHVKESAGILGGDVDDDILEVFYITVFLISELD